MRTLSAGIGLRAAHYASLLEQRPQLALVEVHSENYFGGLPLQILQKVREHYPVSLHGVGLSLGASGPLSLAHLRQLRDLVERVEPTMVSEHLCWNSHGAVHLHDLLPLPFCPAALAHFVSRISQVQDFLKRPLLLENITRYVKFQDDSMHEGEFLNEIARRSGCQLLLDVNNLYLNANNHGLDAYAELDAVNTEFVGEFHLSGHTLRTWEGGELLLDTHDQPVSEGVWALYQHALNRCGARASQIVSVIEWDRDLPSFEVLLQQAQRAQSYLDIACQVI